MSQPHIGSGGFAPFLKRTTVATSPGAAFLASEDYTPKLNGVTIKQGSGRFDAGTGRYILDEGSLIVPNTGTDPVEVGRWSNYDPDVATKSTLDPDKSLYTLEAIDTSDSDVICGALIRADLLAARIHPPMVADPEDTDAVAEVAAIKAAIGHRYTFQ